MSTRYMRVRSQRTSGTCSKPGCNEPATWWGVNIPDGKLLMCDTHKTNYADELLGA